jgi:hypothetical protein
MFCFHIPAFLRVSIVSDYGLDDRGLIPERGRGCFFNLSFYTGSGAHQTSCTMGTGVPSERVDDGRDVTLTTHPPLVPRLKMCGSSSPSASMACGRTTYLTFTVYAGTLAGQGFSRRYIFMAMHTFVSAFRDAKFYGVSDVSLAN